MGIRISVFLIALGAGLSFAVNLTVSGLELDTIGVILMVVGAIGLVASLVIWGAGLVPARWWRTATSRSPRSPAARVCGGASEDTFWTMATMNPRGGSLCAASR